MCVGVIVFTCVDNSKAVCQWCPVLAVTVVVMLWLWLLWMDSPDSAAPLVPNPTRHKYTHE